MDSFMLNDDSTMIFDHLGVLAPDLAQGRTLLSVALGVRRWTVEFEDSVNDVFVQFGQGVEGPCYEIVAPRSSQSPVRNALRKGVNILNHVAYRVGDLVTAARQLERAGLRAIGEARPAIAYGHRPIQFFIGPQMLMVELIEAPAHRHLYLAETESVARV